jgi:predicted branched-subunit amino acid permease
MRRVLSTSISVGLATGLYGISFGALAAASGLDLLSVMLLSLLMFSGGSQFAFLGVIAGGGTPIAAITSAWLLGVRNHFYALRLNSVLHPKGLVKTLASQLTIDESNAVSASQESLKNQRIGFWATGIAVFVFWNIATFLGAIAGDLLGSVETWGLDAAAAAAFLGLVWAKLRDSKLVALSAAVVALVGSLFLPAGVPVLLTVLVALYPGGKK